MGPIGAVKIEATLFGRGLELNDYLIVGSLPMAWGESRGAKHPWMFPILDADLRQACVEYLRTYGAKEYA